MSNIPALPTTEPAAARRGPLVVLGSSGLLGQALLRVAAARGWRTLGLSRRSLPGTDLAADTDLGPLLDPLAPALVVNAAALTDLAACEADPAAAADLHAHLPARLAEWGRRRCTPWVQVSTDHYWCGPSNRLHGEDAALQPPNVYARSKREGELQALRDPGCLVLRTNIVGLRGWPNQPSFVEWVLAALHRGQPFDAYTDVWASSLEVHQFAAALFDLVECGATGLVHLAARESLSKADFIAALAHATGHDPTLARRVPRPAAAQPPRANAMGLDVARAETFLGRRLPDAGQVIAALAAACAAAASPASPFPCHGKTEHAAA